MDARRKQKPCELWEKKQVRSPSGAIKEDWEKHNEPIRVALYDKSAQNQLVTGAAGLRMKQYDYLGLSKNKTLAADHYKLVDDVHTYLVKGVNNEGRLAQLFLAVIEDGE